MLVFRARPELRLIRRYALPGGPAAIDYDEKRRRIWTVLSEANEIIELRAGARIGVLDRFPPSGARSRAVAGDRVLVTNGDEIQVLDARR